MHEKGGENMGAVLGLCYGELRFKGTFGFASRVNGGVSDFI